jgi:hypothetical protein
MPQTNETRASDARVSSNQLGRWLLESRTVPSHASQANPSLIAVHLGLDFVAAWVAQGDSNG